MHPISATTSAAAAMPQAMSALLDARPGMPASRRSRSPVLILADKAVPIGSTDGGSS